MSAIVDCVLSEEVSNYLKLKKHSVLNNKINTITLGDSLLSFLGYVQDNPCSTYTQVCEQQSNCSIVVKFLSTDSICKKPLIKLT